MNPLILAASALVPLVIGYIWYHPILFGNAWMKASDVSEEKLKTGNMAIIFAVTYLLSFMLASALTNVVIHQNSFFSILANEAGLKETGSEVNTLLTNFMAKYGTNFRTFKHGTFHGVLTALFLALPLLGIGALFERRGFKYIAIHTGYWVVTLGLMGGILCQFS